jgi:hypoxanthine-DNA glycosylase
MLFSTKGRFYYAGDKMQKYTHIVHGFEPIFDKQSKILILGSLPSVKSREQGFYYGHPRNRFWKVLAAVTDMPVPNTVSEKREFLTAVHIAVWDVIQQCDIIGSSDASIKNVVPTDIQRVLDGCDIKAVFANGSTAAKLYDKYQKPLTDREINTLPSTSPANAAYSLERLLQSWKCLLGYL